MMVLRPCSPFPLVVQDGHTPDYSNIKHMQQITGQMNSGQMGDEETTARIYSKSVCACV